MRTRFSRKTIIVVSLVSGLLLFSVGSYFQPWKLFTDTRVEEALPQLTEPKATAENSPQTQAESKAVEEEKASKPEDTEKVTEENLQLPVVLTEGSFISHEHSTTGSVKILQYSDGSRILRIENLETSNGPKLEVWLTDAPVINGVDGWRVFDDGKYLNLGVLKGNIGSQNYVIPTDTNLDEFSSISIWCERFSVSFGAATLSLP
ncbi:MAG: secreted protein [Actinobacteria bacterium]|jgi:hypothetical protein|nr:secreted protein [Actinomycetota bacterium]